MFKLNNFKTEYQTYPLGVENPKPRFSWEYGLELKGRQKIYKIYVATSIDLLTAGSPDMWNSGEVQSENCIGIEYNGKPLKSRTRYFVKCFCKDDSDNIYESETAIFETGLLNKEDWKGKWVGVPVNFNGGTLLFRKIIVMPDGKKITRARAYICGLGYHEFFVNGVKMGDSVLNPSVTAYDKRVLYCVYDMAGLNEGENVIGIELGYGWFGTRKLLAQFYVEFDDGSVYEDHSAPCHGWWVGGSPTVENGIYSGEIYDARLEDKIPKNWNTLDFEPTWENGWMYTIYIPAPEGKLEAQQIEPIKVCAAYPEKKRACKGGGVFICDVGYNIAGWARITVKGERGARVTLKFGEDLTDDGYVNQLNLRSARCSDIYILKGEGEEEYAPRFTYHGFRYVQVEIEGKAELLTLTAEHVHTDTEIIGGFECSLQGLNALHNMAVLTEHNNEHSILTDCPQRDERFGWLNDLSARVYQTVYNVNMARFFPKFLKDITDTQTEKGEIADTAPYFTGSIPADPVSVIYLLLATYGYRYYGDVKICKEEYKNLKMWVDYLLSRSKNYIMDYAYYADWVVPYPEKVKADNIYVSTVYLLWHLQEMKKLALITGNRRDASVYDKHIKKSIKAINDKYFNKKTFNYSKGTQTENALAVSLGIVSKKDAQKVAENVYNDVVANNHHCTSGNIGYRHVFYVLADYGYSDEVINILLNKEYPGWGYMLEKGATSVWERWENEMQNEMHSFNHPMFGSYDAFLYKYLGGISVDEEAFACDKIKIKPVFTDKLDFVKSTYKTVRGQISCEWKRLSGKIYVHVEIPPMTAAEVEIGNNKGVFTAGSHDFVV